MGQNRRVGPEPSSDDVPRPWPGAWHDALYGSGGFYRSAPPARHFATSAQGIPGGGEVLAAAVAELAHRHGCTRVVDVGAGGGELLAAVHEIDPELALVGVDVVDRAPPGTGMPWLVSPGGAALPDGLAGPGRTLAVGHEWLDVVPCPVVERDASGSWREVLVRRDGVEVLGPAVAGDNLGWLERWVPEDVARAEVGLPRDRAAADLLARLGDGVLLLVDYGHEREARPPGGSLTGYRDGRQVAPVPDGSCDVTAHVALDSLVDGLRGEGRRVELTSQRDALADLLPGADAPVPHELARSRPTAYLRALARRAALGALSAPGGLGDFGWVTVVVPPPGGAAQ